MFSPSHQDEEWVELYLYSNLTGNFSGWVLGIVGGKNLTIPDTDVAEYGYLAVHFGSSGANPSNNTQYSKHVFLNETVESLNNTGGALHFIHPNGSVLDSVVWGKSPSGVQLWNSSVSPVHTTDPNKSISIWGKDLNSAENWYESHPTPAKPNVEIFNITNPDLTIKIYNGYHEPDMNFSEGYFVGGPIKVSAHPTVAGKKNEIKEYASFSLKFYKEEGYGDPELGSDGEVDIWVGKGIVPATLGETTPMGSIWLHIGTIESNIWLKYVVEHELFHTIQLKKFDNFSHETENKEWWWDEGMAVWWGIKSTMKNFNKSLTQVMDEFKRVGGHNWDTHWTSMNLNLFDTFEPSYNNYIGSFFFIKFLNETFGIDILKNIHNRIKRDVNKTVIVGAKTAIEDELGKSFEKILQQFYQWRVLNATRDNGAPVSTPDSTLDFMSTEVNDAFLVKPTGAVLEQINVLNETEEMRITISSDSPLMITSIIYYKNDSKRFSYFKMNSTHLTFSVSSKNVSKIQLIKKNLIGTATANVATQVIGHNPRVDPKVNVSLKIIRNDEGLLLRKEIYVDIEAYPGSYVTATLLGPDMSPIIQSVTIDNSGQKRLTFTVYAFGEYTVLVEIGEFSFEKIFWA
jgi:hypothetical protein